MFKWLFGDQSEREAEIEAHIRLMAQHRKALEYITKMRGALAKIATTSDILLEEWDEIGGDK